MALCVEMQSDIFRPYDWSQIAPADTQYCALFNVTGLARIHMCTARQRTRGTHGHVEIFLLLFETKKQNYNTFGMRK